MPRAKKVTGRCKGKNKNGNQCKRKTQRSFLCYIHIKSEKNLQIKKSGIPKTGLGLFTLKDIKKNQKIVDYGGILKHGKVPENQNTDYVLELTKNKYIDASPKLSNSSIGAYSNMCRTVNKKKKECKGNNSNLATNRNRTDGFLKATKPIKKNDEIFTSYGNAYW